MKDIVKEHVPALARKADTGWTENAPAEIRFSSRSSKTDPVRVFKHNYLGVESEYELDYFRHSPENLNLDNVNNHVTDSYFGLVSGGKGMAVAADNTVLSNFAFSPLRMSYDQKTDLFEIRANPFGTYHGEQYRPPTRGNGQGYEAAIVAGEQYASSAPTYNGASHEFSIMLAFFDGDRIPEKTKRELMAYANPPVAVFMENRKPNDTGLSSAFFPSLDFSPGKSDDAFFSKTKIVSGDDDARPDGVEVPVGPNRPIPLGLKMRVVWESMLAKF